VPGTALFVKCTFKTENVVSEVAESVVNVDVYGVKAAPLYDFTPLVILKLYVVFVSSAILGEKLIASPPPVP
jgi:hypothetical protein